MKVAYRGDRDMTIICTEEMKPKATPYPRPDVDPHPDPRSDPRPDPAP